MHSIVANHGHLYNICDSIMPPRHTVSISLHSIHRNTLRDRDALPSIHLIDRRQFFLTTMCITPMLYLLPTSDGGSGGSSLRIVQW